MSDNACPAYRYVDHGDFAEPEKCYLPIEHNIDGSWHEASWSTDDTELSVRWAPEVGEVDRWPRHDVSPMGESVERLWSDGLVAQILAPSVLDRLPVTTGSAITFRKWGQL